MDLNFIGNTRKESREMRLLCSFSKFLQEIKTDIAKLYKMY